MASSNANSNSVASASTAYAQAVQMAAASDLATLQDASAVFNNDASTVAQVEAQMAALQTNIIDPQRKMTVSTMAGFWGRFKDQIAALITSAQAVSGS